MATVEFRRNGNQRQVRITRQSSDGWCLDQLQSQTDTIRVRTTATSGGTLTVRAASASYSTSADSVTISYTTSDTYIFDVGFWTISGGFPANRLLYIDWNRRVLIPAGSFAGQWRSTSPFISHLSAINCDTVDPPTASLLINGVAGAITVTSGLFIVMTWASQNTQSASITRDGIDIGNISVTGARILTGRYSNINTRIVDRYVLSVTGDDGSTRTASVILTVLPVATTDSNWSSMVRIPRLNRPPVLQDPVNVSVQIGASRTIFLSASDPDGDDITFSARRSNTRFSFSVNSAAALITVTGITAGTGILTITPQDEHGLVGIAQTVTITVTAVSINNPPVLNSPGNQTVEVGASRTISLFASDPDGDDVSFTGSRSNTAFSASFNNSANTLTLTGNSAGSGTLTITPRDEHGLAGAAQTITVTVVAAPNRSPVWSPPAAFNVNVNDDITINLNNFCSDPDGDALTYGAAESSTYYSESISGNILTLNGGSTHRIDAGDITLAANDGRGGAATVAIQVNVIDTSRNTPPVIIPPTAPWPTAIVDGRGTGSGVVAGEQWTATDVDGDAINRWEVEAPSGRGWSNFTSSAGPLGQSTTPNAHQTGFTRIVGVQDYYARLRESVYIAATSPSHADRLVSYRARCRDARGAWSEWVSAQARIIQPVHGNNFNVDIFSEEPDRRLPNIWAFKKGATTTTHAGGVRYQYATPADAIADRDGWVGSITYNARELWFLVRGSRPPNSAVLVNNLANVHPSLTATLDGNEITFTPHANSVARERSSYFGSWETLCTIDVQDDDDLRYYTFSIDGFIFIIGDETEDSEWSNMVHMVYANQPPVCRTLPNQTVSVGGTRRLDLTSFLSDPEGDDITITVSESDANISISGVSASAHSFNINGISVGTAVVTVVPTDEHGRSGTSCTFTVTVPNRPPVCAALPNRRVQVNNFINVDLTSYLSDPDGHSITIAVSESDANISISNVNSSAHSFRINGLSTGSAVVTVSPTDSRGLTGTSCTFTVTVGVSNLPPVCSELPNRNVRQGGSLVVDLSLYLSDSDGDDITIAVARSNSRITLTNLSVSAHSFTINGISVGATTVTVTPTDEHGLVGTACTFTVTVISGNLPPECSTLPNRAVVSGEFISVDLSSYLSDPDGDSITIAVSENDANISITSLSTAGHSFSINGLSVGTAVVTVTPTDEHDLAGEACAFTVTVVASNRPPECSTLPTRTVTVGNSIDVDLSSYLSDPDSDSISIGVVENDANISITGLNVDAHTFTVNGLSEGSAIVFVTPTDSQGLTGISCTFAVIVQRFNRPPVCTGISNRNTVVGASLFVDVSSSLSDPDGDSITIQVSESDANISITSLNVAAHSFRINGLSQGTARVTVIPIDEHGLAGTSCTFTVTVNPDVGGLTRQGCWEITVGPNTGGFQVGVPRLYYIAFPIPEGYTVRPTVRYGQNSGGPEAYLGLFLDSITEAVFHGYVDIRCLVLRQQPPTCATLPTRSIKMGEALNVDISSFLRDPDNDAISIEVVSSTEAVTVTDLNATAHSFTLTAVSIAPAIITVTPTDSTGLRGTPCFFDVEVVGDSEWSEMVKIPEFNHPPECDDVPDQTMAVGETLRIPWNIQDPDRKPDESRVTILFGGVIAASFAGANQTTLVRSYDFDTGIFTITALPGAELAATGQEQRAGRWVLLARLRDNHGLEASCQFNLQVTMEVLIGQVGVEALIGTVLVENLLGAIYVENFVGIIPVEVFIERIYVEVFIGRVSVQALVGRMGVEVFIGRVTIEDFIGKIEVEAFIGQVELDVFIGRVPVRILVEEISVETFLSRVEVEAFIGRVEVEAFIGRIYVGAFIGRVEIEVFLGRILVITPLRWVDGTTDFLIRYEHDLWWAHGDVVDETLSEAVDGVPPYLYSIEAINIADQGQPLTDYADALLPAGIGFLPTLEAASPHQLMGTVGSGTRGQYVFLQRCDDAIGQFIIRIYRLFVGRGAL